jgi:hypothetical protein
MKNAWIVSHSGSLSCVNITVTSLYTSFHFVDVTETKSIEEQDLRGLSVRFIVHDRDVREEHLYYYMYMWSFE